MPTIIFIDFPKKITKILLEYLATKDKFAANYVENSLKDLVAVILHCHLSLLKNSLQMY